VDSNGIALEVSSLTKFYGDFKAWMMSVSRILVIVQMLLNNTIEEKSNRIIEVLLSSVTPENSPS